MSTPSTCERPSAERAAAGRRTRTATQAQALPSGPAASRQIIVSNRLPYRVDVDESGEVSVTRSAGGLATALGPLHERSGNLWIGWARRRRGARRGRGGAHGRGAGRARLHADTSGRGRRGAVLRGLLELHAVAAFPRLSPEHALRPEGVGGLCPRERAVLRRRGRGRAPGRRGVGPGLPPDASAFARAGGGARGAGRLLFAHPLP